MHAAKQMRKYYDMDERKIQFQKDFIKRQKST